MHLIRLIEIYPFRLLFYSYILFLFFIAIFISIYSHTDFFISVIILFLYNLFFFIIVLSIVILLVLGVNIQKKVQYLIYFLILSLIIVFGKMYKIDENFYQSLTHMSIMQKNLKSGYFNFVGEERKYKMVRVKELITLDTPFAIDNKNRIVILNCQLFYSSCSDVSKGEFYNKTHFVEYYDQGDYNYLMFKVVSENGNFIDYKKRYINNIKHKRALVFGYFSSALLIMFYIACVFRFMNNGLIKSNKN